MATPPPSNHSGGPRSPFEHPAIGKRILIALSIVCALVFVLDAAYHKHGHFSFEDWFGFHAFAGFLAYSFIVLSAKLLRRVLKRGEDYYD